jgi:hypothetical protein
MRIPHPVEGVPVLIRNLRVAGDTAQKPRGRNCCLVLSGKLTTHETTQSALGRRQRLSLRSLAFILCSAWRRAFLSCSPDIINGRKQRTEHTHNETKTDKPNETTKTRFDPMCSLLPSVYPKGETSGLPVTRPERFYRINVRAVRPPGQLSTWTCVLEKALSGVGLFGLPRPEEHPGPFSIPSEL